MANEILKISEEEALRNFLLNIDCLDELLPWTSKFNLFDVLKISRTEIRHSNVLGWLLNPNENHQLGDSFIKGLLQRLVENDSTGKYAVFKILLMDYFSFTVLREWKNIDILLMSSEEKTLIAFENKVGSQEHSNQLNRYRAILENEYPEYSRIYIYLTPDGTEPSDSENWDVLTYNDILEILETVSLRVQLQPDVKFMINNYIDVIRRDIVEDQQLIEICNRIYNKHKKALDLIFENRTDGKAQITDSIKATLQRLNDEGIIIYEDDSRWYTFRTKTMDTILPLLDSTNSAWGTSNTYNYWLNVRDGRFHGVFELGGWNVPESTMETMQRIIDILKPGDKKRDDFRYKRLYRTKWFDASELDDIDAEIEPLVRQAVNELLLMESSLIKNLSVK